MQHYVSLGNFAEGSEGAASEGKLREAGMEASKSQRNAAQQGSWARLKVMRSDCACSHLRKNCGVRHQAPSVAN